MFRIRGVCEDDVFGVGVHEAVELPCIISITHILGLVNCMYINLLYGYILSEIKENPIIYRSI